jgi:creatinine amidohydrolase
LATAEKGREVYEEAVKQLVRFVTWFKDRPKDIRRDLHRRPPTMAMPWNQGGRGKGEGLRDEPEE